MSHPPGPPDPSHDPTGPDDGSDPWAPPPPDRDGATEHPEHGQPDYRQTPYGQPDYGPTPYGQPQYGQPDYGQQQPPYGRAPYGAGYPQPGYGPYGYQGYRPARNGKATAAMWTGIGTLVLTFCCGGGILGVVPIVLGVKARKEIRAGGGQQEGDGMALAGIITGTIAIVLSLVVIAFIVIAVVANQSGDNFGQTGV
jgi:hypothetical protein